MRSLNIPLNSPARGSSVTFSKLPASQAILLKILRTTSLSIFSRSFIAASVQRTFTEFSHYSFVGNPPGRSSQAYVQFLLKFWLQFQARVRVSEYLQDFLLYQKLKVLNGQVFDFCHTYLLALLRFFDSFCNLI